MSSELATKPKDALVGHDHVSHAFTSCYRWLARPLYANNAINCCLVYLVAASAAGSTAFAKAGGVVPATTFSDLNFDPQCGFSCGR